MPSVEVAINPYHNFFIASNGSPGYLLIISILEHRTKIRAECISIAEMRVVELYASILENVFVTGAKLLYKRASKKASAEEISLTHDKIGNSVVTHADSAYKFFVKLTRHNPSGFTKLKDNGDYKMYYHPLILNEVLMMSGLWEIYVKRALTVAPDDVFVDVGAHLGSYAIPVAKKAQKVIAFEPNKYTFELLTKNISLNHLTNIEAYNIAVSKKRGAVSFIYENESLYSRIIDRDQSKNVTVIQNSKAHKNNIHLVNTIDLDSVLLKEDRVDWIKIDVEGHELDVLEGAVQTIHMHKPKIIIELAPWNVQKLNSMTRSFRYSIAYIYGGYYFLKPY
jgi:FkbM family methyltransferase